MLLTPKAGFIVGTARSGTSLLQSILSINENIFTLPETHIFKVGFKPIFSGRYYYTTRSVRDVIRNFIDLDVLDSSESKEQLNILAKNLKPYSLRTMQPILDFVNILDIETIYRGKDCWIEKTPSHLSRIPMIRKALKMVSRNPKFVHIVRDGRDVVASLHKASQQWGTGYSVERCIKRWNTDIELTSVAITKSPEQNIVVFYDRLVENPEKEARKIYNYLGIKSAEFNLEKRKDMIGNIVTKGEIWKKGLESDVKLSSTFSDYFANPERKKIENNLDSELYEKLRNKH